MNKKLKKRATGAIGRYLDLMGYETLEANWRHGDDKVDYIIDDMGCVAFVFGRVRSNLGVGIPDESVDRKAFERLAAAYFAEHPELADCPVRADAVSLLVLSDNRALIRHHKDALSACGLDLRP
ncbi:MAG: YraN family protein [Eggerthellaceae bacterium]|nr:YraN family protein [Eggerthellaceae bacterium]